MILSFLASLILACIAIILSYILVQIIELYLHLREPIIAHFGFIGIFLFLTFISGAIGVFLELDQQSDVLFDYNLLFLSLTYFGFGLIYKELNVNGNTLINDYSLIVLGVAPGFAISQILGAEFIPLMAISSQLIPLVLIVVMEQRILNATSNPLLKNHELEVASLLHRIFKAAIVIHSLGLVVMIGFSIIFLSGNVILVEAIWLEPWDWFDYLYFIGAIIIMIAFILIARKMKDLRVLVSNARLDTVINSVQM